MGGIAPRDTAKGARSCFNFGADDRHQREFSERAWIGAFSHGGGVSTFGQIGGA